LGLSGEFPVDEIGGRGLSQASQKPPEPQLRSPTISELQDDLADDGWEPDLDELIEELTDPEPEMLPSVPRGWRIFPKGTFIDESTVALLLAEVERHSGIHRRTRPAASLPEFRTERRRRKKKRKERTRTRKEKKRKKNE